MPNVCSICQSKCRIAPSNDSLDFCSFFPSAQKNRQKKKEDFLLVVSFCSLCDSQIGSIRFFAGSTPCKWITLLFLSRMWHKHSRYSPYYGTELHSQRGIDCCLFFRFFFFRCSIGAVTKKSPPFMLEFIYKWPTYNAWLTTQRTIVRKLFIIVLKVHVWFSRLRLFQRPSYLSSMSSSSFVRCVTIPLQFISTNLLDKFHEIVCSQHVNSIDSIQRITFSHIPK